MAFITWLGGRSKSILRTRVKKSAARRRPARARIVAAGVTVGFEALAGRCRYPHRPLFRLGPPVDPLGVSFAVERERRPRTAGLIWSRSSWFPDRVEALFCDRTREI